MTDYCGSTGTEFVPDLFPNACRKHDECYANTMMTQHDCDWIFMSDMAKEEPVLIPIALLFFFAVFVFGARAKKRATMKS